jgi:hypothetical protein
VSLHEGSLVRAAHGLEVLPFILYDYQSDRELGRMQVLDGGFLIFGHLGFLLGLDFIF